MANLCWSYLRFKKTYTVIRLTLKKLHWTHKNSKCKCCSFQLTFYAHSKINGLNKGNYTDNLTFDFCNVTVQSVKQDCVQIRHLSVSTTRCLTKTSEIITFNTNAIYYNWTVYYKQCWKSRKINIRYHGRQVLKVISPDEKLSAQVPQENSTQKPQNKLDAH